MPRTEYEVHELIMADIAENVGANPELLKIAEMPNRIKFPTDTESGIPAGIYEVEGDIWRKQEGASWPM